MVLEHGAGWEVIGTHATGNETKETLCGFLPPQSLKLPWYFIFLKPECPTVFFFFLNSFLPCEASQLHFPTLC